MSASQFFSDAADALAREQDDVAAGALSAAADAVSGDYPHIAAATRMIRDLTESCDLIRRRRIAAIVDCQTWAREFGAPTVVPCICGCGETAIVFEGDDTFYQEGQTEDHCSDWSDYERAMARRGYTFVPVTDELRAAVNGLAAVSMPLALSEGGPWRITVQYLDDTRMECEFASLEAVRTFRARLPPFLWMEYLESLGFTFA